MSYLILLRHGQSVWNAENRFTGWMDVDLSDAGEAEARDAGVLIRQSGIQISAAYTSVLKRAVRTANIVLDTLDICSLNLTKHWRLNERHYGALTGLNKKETADQYGIDQVKIWRRSYDIPPPALEDSDERHPRFNPIYKFLPLDALPSTECLKDVVNRALPFWQDYLARDLLKGKNVLVAAHGNSIRALLKHLEKIYTAGDICSYFDETEGRCRGVLRRYGQPGSNNCSSVF